MAYNESLADLLREDFFSLIHVREMTMMGGLVFMLNEKMCIGILGDEMMVRINPELFEDALENDGVRPLDESGRSMKGFLLLDQNIWNNPKKRAYWFQLCIEFNPIAIASKKKKSKN